MSSKLINQKLHFPRSKHSIHFHLLFQFMRHISDFSREERGIPSILDSYSQEAPTSRAGDLASSKIKYNISSFYNKVDKLSCHERYDVVHNILLQKFSFPSTINSR